MYSLIRDVGLRNVLRREAPTGIVSIVIAELFYKFHSFTLECVAFLATWFVISFVCSSVVAAIRGQSRSATP